jgi:thiamine biosynthesis protein ThiS
VNIYFNGEQREVTSSTIIELIAEFKLTGKRIAIERNKEIVPRSAYAETKLSDGDQIEVVHFVGGG